MTDKLRERILYERWSEKQFPDAPPPESAWLAWQARAAIAAAPPEPKYEPVAWFKHGPYVDDEPQSCVFEDPHDDVCYSALIFADPEFRRTKKP